MMVDNLDAGSQRGDVVRERLAGALERDVDAVLRHLRGEPGADGVMATLVASRAAGDTIEEVTRLLVADARGAGRTWQEIGQLLSVTRQAAQQRYGDRPAGAEVGGQALAARASEIVRQLASGDLAAVSVDWDETLRSKLSIDALADAWRQVGTGAGPLQEVGDPVLSRRGPYRVADVPLQFAHGPMKARITFNHDGTVGGLFVLLPDAP